MLKLIKLELQKNKLSTYLYAVLFIGLGILGLTFLLGLSSQLVELTGDTLSPDEILLLNNWTNFSTVISTISMVSFAVMSSIMYARFVIIDYAGKGTALLFSYPIKRSKILLSKCLLVFSFTVMTMIFCNITILSIFGLFSNMFHLLEQPFDLWFFITLLPKTFALSFLSASIGLISLRIGFLKKSIPTTIISAIVLTALCSNLFSFTLDRSIFVILFVMGFSLLIGLISFIGLSQKVNQMEVL